MNRELMTHVERAVRPVGTHHAKRMQMREELYGLIDDIYQEELEQSDEDTAVAAAIRRFGPAEELTVELRSTLNVWDRVAYFEERVLAPRPRSREGVLRHAVRTARNASLLTAAWMLPMLIFFQIRGGTDDGEWVMLAMWIGFAGAVFLETIVGHATYRLFRRERWSLPAVGTFALLQAISGGAVLLIGFGVVWCSSLSLDAATQGLCYWLAPAVGCAILAPVYIRVLQQRSRREEPLGGTRARIAGSALARYESSRGTGLGSRSPRAMLARSNAR